MAIDKAEDYLKQAGEYSSQGEWEKAILACEQAIAFYWEKLLQNKESQRSPEGFVQLGDILLQQNKARAAIACYRRAIELNPYLAKAYEHLAEALAKLQQWEEATFYYRQALEIEETQSAVSVKADATLHLEDSGREGYQMLLDKANVLRSQGKLDEAISTYLQCIEIEPLSPEIHANLGTLYAQQQKWQEAISAYKKAIEIAPTFAGVYRNLARVLDRVGQTEAATQYWYQSLTLEPNWAKAEDYFSIGNSLRLQGKTEEAIICYRRAIQLKPDLTEAYYRLGEILNKEGQKEEAISLYRIAVKHNPENLAFHYRLVQALASQGKWQEVIACYRRAIELDSHSALVYFNLGKVLEHIEQWDEAIDCYRKASELQPTLWEAHYHLGEIFQKQGKMEEASGAYRHAIELEPNYSWCHYKLGEILTAKGELEAAITALRRAIELRGDVAEFHFCLGEVFLAKGKIEEATFAYQKTLEIDPKIAMAQLKLGKILNQQGDWQGAFNCYLKTIELQPEILEPYLSLRYNLLRYHFPKIASSIDLAIAIFQEAVTKQPDLIIAQSCLGYALTKKGELSQAIVILQEASDRAARKNYQNIDKNIWQTASRQTPQFIIIGAEKSGTSSLYQYIIQHPQIFPALEKELDFFDVQFELGMDWYLAHFPQLPQGYLTGEASPNYLYSYIAPENILAQCPQVKLIAICRNPIDRSYSRYQMMQRNGWEKKTFEEAIAQEMGQLKPYFQQTEIPRQVLERCRYLGNSLYLEHFKRWLAVFPQEQLHIIQSEELYKNPAQTMTGVWEFLQVPGMELSEYPQYNSGEYEPLELSTRKNLAAFFQTPNLQLEKYLGMRFNWEEENIPNNIKVYKTKKIAGGQKLASPLQAYEAAVTERPDSAEIHTNLGSLYAQEKQWSAAIASFQKALEIDPNFVGAYRNLARVLTQVQKLEEADEAWHKALSLEPNWTTPAEHVKLGNRFKERLQYERARDCYERAIALQADLLEAYLQLAEIALLQGKKAEALSFHRQALVQNPENFQAHFLLGQTLSFYGAFDEGISYYRQAISLQPDAWIVYHNLGIALSRQDKWEEASAQFQSAIALKQDFCWSHYSLAETLSALKRWDEAIASFLNAIAIQIDLAGIYKKFGYALKQKWQEDLEGAISLYKESIPLPVELQQREFYTRLADNFKQNKHFDSAIIFYSLALNLDGENTQLEFHLQEAQAEKIKLSEEIAAYREKIVQRPELPWNYCHLGNILADLGEDAEPIALQQQASVLRGWHEAGETRNYRFHYDWFTHNISIWQKYLEGFIDLPNLKILEIGSFEGMATCWFLDRILTHPSAKITCIDIYFQRDFDYNIAQTQSSEKVTKLIGSSHEILQTLDRQSYDAIYIDGNHAASHVRQDGLLCWDLLKYEGLAIFDDYELTYRNHPEDNPQVGIDAFLESVKNEIEVIYKGYQLIVRKKLAT